MKINRCGSQKFTDVYKKKFYRGYLAEGREFHYTLKKFRKATEAGLYAMDMFARYKNLLAAFKPAISIEYGFDLEYALSSGDLGEVSKSQVDSIAFASIQYAKSSIMTASAATLLEALALEVKNEKPRKTLLKMLVSKINKHEAMVLSEYKVSLKNI